MPFSTALAGSLLALWLRMAQKICQKSMTQETSHKGCSFLDGLRQAPKPYSTKGTLLYGVGITGCAVKRW